MRSKPLPYVEEFRIAGGPYASPQYALHGAFRIRDMTIISSGTLAPDWEHVSVSLQERCPTWEEMVRIKDLFWKKTETVIQFHPAIDAYVNEHPFCLHLWKQVGKDYELPPMELIGKKK